MMWRVRALVRRVEENIPRRIANMLPKRVVYFAAIRLIAYATTGKYGSTVVPELGAMDAVGRYEAEAGLEATR